MSEIFTLLYCLALEDRPSTLEKRKKTQAMRVRQQIAKKLS